MCSRWAGVLVAAATATRTAEPTDTSAEGDAAGAATVTEAHVHGGNHDDPAREGQFMFLTISGPIRPGPPGSAYIRPRRDLAIKDVNETKLGDAVVKLS